MQYVAYSTLIKQYIMSCLLQKVGDYVPWLYTDDYGYDQIGGSVQHYELLTYVMVKVSASSLILHVS